MGGHLDDIGEVRENEESEGHERSAFSNNPDWTIHRSYGKDNRRGFPTDKVTDIRPFGTKNLLVASCVGGCVALLPEGCNPATDLVFATAGMKGRASGGPERYRGSTRKCRGRRPRAFGLF